MKDTIPATFSQLKSTLSTHRQKVSLLGGGTLLLLAILLTTLLSTTIIKERTQSSTLAATVDSLECTTINPPLSFVTAPEPVTTKELSGEIQTITDELQKEVSDYNRASAKEKSNRKQTLRDKAQRRKQLIMETMRKNPDSAYRALITKESKEQLPTTGSCSEQPTTIEGIVETYHADYPDQKTSETITQITSADGNSTRIYPTRFAKAQLKEAKKIRVTGFRFDNEVLVTSAETLQAQLVEKKPLAFFDSFNLLAHAQTSAITSGRTIVILINFANTTEIYDKNLINTDFFSRLNNYYKEQSYNKKDITGQVVGPYTIATNANCPAGIPQEVITAADPDVNFTDVSHIMMLAPFPCSWSGTASIGSTAVQTGEGTITVGAVKVNMDRVRTTKNYAGVAAHEIGHNLRARHAGFLNCLTSTDACRNLITSNGQPDFTKAGILEFGDQYDVMGDVKNLPHMSSLHKQLIGWFNPQQLMTVTQSGVYTLSPYETNTNELKAIRIKRGVNSWGQDEYLYAEYRTGTGFDSDLAGNASQGALLHVDWDLSSFGGGNDSILIDPSSPPTDVFSSALLPGQSYRDPLTATELKVISRTPTALQINVMTNTITTLFPSADAYVTDDKPKKNFGNKNFITIQSKPKSIGFIKFNTSSLTGKRLVSAVLRVSVVNTSPGSLRVLSSNASWSEKNLTWQNRPNTKEQLAVNDTINTRGYVNLDVTNAVSSKLGEVVSFALTNSHKNDVIISSNEENTGKPQLVLTYQ